MKAVILAAGKSTRTFPLTVNRPKVLLKVMNKTLLEHNLDQLKGLVDEVIVVVGFKKEMIIEYMGNEYNGLKLTYVEQKEQTGTGSALKAAEGKIDDRFIMLYGDDMYSATDLKECVSKQYSILAKKVENPKLFGILESDGKYLKRIVEKPKEFISDLANCGAFVMDKKIFDLTLEKTERGEYEVTDYITALAGKEKVEIVVVNDYWTTIGYPWNILEANSHFLKSVKSDIQGTVEDNVSITGEVIIGKGTIVRAGTVIEGPVVIGEDCVIGPQAYIRPETTIGNRCKVRAEMYDAVIGDECVLKHYSYVAHSVLGEDVNIGAGTVTSDYRHDGKNHITIVKDSKIDTYRRKLGSFMGDHVRTAINTSIYPGRKIWPWTGTLPGEVVTKDKMDMGLKN